MFFNRNVKNKNKNFLLSQLLDISGDSVWIPGEPEGWEPSQ